MLKISHFDLSSDCVMKLKDLLTCDLCFAQTRRQAQ